MTPQTPRAALSDADIDKIALEVIYEGDTSIPYRQEWCNDIGRPFARAILAAADRRLTAEQGGAEMPKPFCHVVNMLEGLPENPSYIMLFDGQRFGNGFTHTALYTGEQLVAALTTQPQAQPTGWIRVEDRLPPKFEEVLVFFRDGTLAATGQYTDNQHDHDGWCYPAECHAEDEWPVVSHWMPLPATPTAPTEPT